MTPLDLTVLIPWNGEDEPLLHAAIKSLPKHRGIRYIVAKNDSPLEMAPAMNAALASIRTEWTLVMGADDLCHEEMVGRLIDGAGSADGAYPTMEAFGAAIYTVHAEPYSRHRQLDENGVPGVLLVRTRVLRAVGGWRPVPLEDWDLAVRIANAGYLLVPVPTARYFYRRRASGLNSRVARCIADGDFTLEELREAICGPKQSWPACFYVSATQGVAYVRGTVMAEHMPAPVRLKFNPDADYAASVWHHPTKDSEAGIREDRRRGRVIVCDVDDNYLHPHLVHTVRFQARWAPHLNAMADQWQKLRPSHRRIASEADVVVCSTPALAEEYAKVNPAVRVVRNAVEPSHWRAPSEEEVGVIRAGGEAPSGASRRLRIGWAAAPQHGPDAEIAEPALRWASAQPGVEVVIIGLDPGWDFPYTHYPPTHSVHQYRDLLQTLDIGVCPLKPGDINKWKSDLKWLEYSMAGAATVASNLEPYETIRHGRTGFLAADKHEFLDYVRILVTEPDIREGLARQARDHVLTSRTSRQAGVEYLAAIGAADREAVAA